MAFRRERRDRHPSPSTTLKEITMLRRSLLALAAILPFCAYAQDYPNKPITLVQGFNAGGNADTIARILAEALSKRLGQEVIVEPKPGAGGNIASGMVAKAPADGYTLILLTGGHAVSAAMYGGFNWSMQHTDCCVSRRSVADEVPDADFLH
jgi:tripartite-type tricarboxylate transporter receptor subunit TctC